MTTRRKPQKVNNEHELIAKELAKSVLEKEKRKVPLKIDSKKTIFVYPENCNDTYRKEYLRKLEESAQIKNR